MIEVLKQMVEALESATVDCSNFHHAKKDQNHNLGECPPVIRWHHAIQAGKQAIKEFEIQEPIYQYQLASGAWIDQTKESHDYNVRHSQATVRVLYTHPPQRKPLTDERIFEVHKQVDSMQYLTFARAIEAAHGIKE